MVSSPDYPHIPDTVHMSGMPDISTILGHHGSTPEPQSPEKNENYGTENGGSLISGLPDVHGFGGVDLNPARSYYENVDQ